MKQSFCVFGKVQSVMFRKTFVRGASQRGFLAGATNDKSDRDRVTCSIVGERDEVCRFLEELQAIGHLNSWGAKVENIQMMEDFVKLNNHEVTTDNLEGRSWNSDIEFYL